MNTKIWSKLGILFLGLQFLTGCGQTESSDNVQARISAVENGLLQQYYKSGSIPAGMSLTDRMAHYCTPGVSIAVVNNGRIEWAKGYGVAVAGGTNTVTTDNLFQACSISKPVAAVGVMIELIRTCFGAV